MVVTTPKPFEEIEASLGDRRRWVVVGCAECAAICQTGGSAQVDEMVAKLAEEGREVIASISLASPCDRRLSRRDFKHVGAELAEVDGVLVLACGGGVQAVADVVDVPVVAGLDAHFVGTVERVGVFHEQCALCGRCVLNETAGLCPVTLCPKGVLNGPCEGAADGRCDAGPDAECVWETIHARLAEQGGETFDRYRPPVDAGRWGRPRTTRKKGDAC